MKSGPLNIETTAVIALAGVLAAWWICHFAEVQSRLDREAIGNQRRQIAGAIAAHARRSLPIAKPINLSGELVRLRAEQERLRVEISELQSALARPPRWGRSSLTRYPIQTNLPEEIEMIDAITAGKKRDIQTLSLALNRYVAEHQGQFPSTIDQLDSFLSRDNLSLTGTNQFDIVYTGTVDELTNFPLRSVAMIRERQPWLSPAGDWTKVYGMYGGRTTFAGWSKIVSSADDFSAFEAEYVVSPPAQNSISQ